MSNINWDFILEQEGFETTGYVPDAENSKSGVTIASGFDLGARKESDLKGLPEEIIELLKPFLGFTGVEASEIAPKLKVSDDQAKIINEFAKSTELAKLKTKWQNATGTNFDDLPTEQATVLTSVAFQYGDLESRTPNFWKQTTSGDWVGAYKNLLNFGDRYESRRLNEAQLLWSSGTLKKSIEDGTSTGILSDEAQSAIENVLSSQEAEGVSEVINQVGETLDGVNITGLETEDTVPGDKPVDQFSVKKDEFLFNSSDELRNKIENDRKEIEKYDPLAGHKNPSFVSPLVEGTYDVISDQDQSIIDNQNLEAQKLLAEKYSIGDISKAAIDSEWIANNVWKMANREDLPNHDFHVTDFLPTKEQKEDLIKGVNEEYHDMLLFNRDGKTLPELYQLKNKLIEIQEREQILMSKGIATGITARLLAAVLDPVAWGAAIASEGILAPAIIMNKASRLTRIIRAGFAAGATNAAIETILMQENPTLDIDDFAIAVGAGFVLGGTLRGLKKIDPNEQALHRAVDDFVNGKEKEMVEDSGLKLTTKGNKKYKVQKTEQDDHNLTVEDYKNTLPSRTTIRTDGNKEIKTPDGKDEYIVTQDGKVIKCK